MVMEFLHGDDIKNIASDVVIYNQKGVGDFASNIASHLEAIGGHNPANFGRFIQSFHRVCLRCKMRYSCKVYGPIGWTCRHWNVCPNYSLCQNEADCVHSPGNTYYFQKLATSVNEASFNANVLAAVKAFDWKMSTIAMDEIAGRIYELSKLNGRWNQTEGDWEFEILNVSPNGYFNWTYEAYSSASHQIVFNGNPSRDKLLKMIYDPFFTTSYDLYDSTILMLHAIGYTSIFSMLGGSYQRNMEVELRKFVQYIGVSGWKIYQHGGLTGSRYMFTGVKDALQLPILGDSFYSQGTIFSSLEMGYLQCSNVAEHRFCDRGVSRTGGCLICDGSLSNQYLHMPTTGKIYECPECGNQSPSLEAGFIPANIDDTTDKYFCRNEEKEEVSPAPEPGYDWNYVCKHSVARNVRDYWDFTDDKWTNTPDFLLESAIIVTDQEYELDIAGGVARYSPVFGIDENTAYSSHRKGHAYRRPDCTSLIGGTPIQPTGGASSPFPDTEIVSMGRGYNASEKLQADESYKRLVSVLKRRPDVNDNNVLKHIMPTIASLVSLEIPLMDATPVSTRSGDSQLNPDNEQETGVWTPKQVLSAHTVTGSLTANLEFRDYSANFMRHIVINLYEEPYVDDPAWDFARDQGRNTWIDVRMASISTGGKWVYRPVDTIAFQDGVDGYTPSAHYEDNNQNKYLQVGDITRVRWIGKTNRLLTATATGATASPPVLTFAENALSSLGYGNKVGANLWAWVGSWVLGEAIIASQNEEDYSMFTVDTVPAGIPEESFVTGQYRVEIKTGVHAGEARWLRNYSSAPILEVFGVLPADIVGETIEFSCHIPVEIDVAEISQSSGSDLCWLGAGFPARLPVSIAGTLAWQFRQKKLDDTIGYTYARITGVDYNHDIGTTSEFIDLIEPRRQKYYDTTDKITLTGNLSIAEGSYVLVHKELTFWRVPYNASASNKITLQCRDRTLVEVPLKLPAIDDFKSYSDDDIKKALVYTPDFNEKPLLDIQNEVASHGGLHNNCIRVDLPAITFTEKADANIIKEFHVMLRRVEENYKLRTAVNSVAMSIQEEWLYNCQRGQSPTLTSKTRETPSGGWTFIHVGKASYSWPDGRAYEASYPGTENVNFAVSEKVGGRLFHLKENDSNRYTYNQLAQEIDILGASIYHYGRPVSYEHRFREGIVDETYSFNHHSYEEYIDDHTLQGTTTTVYPSDAAPVEKLYIGEVPFRLLVFKATWDSGASKWIILDEPALAIFDITTQLPKWSDIDIPNLFLSNTDGIFMGLASKHYGTTETPTYWGNDGIGELWLGGDYYDQGTMNITVRPADIALKWKWKN